jgi:hypothetical protein
VPDWGQLVRAARAPRVVPARIYVGRAAQSASSPQKYQCGSNRDLYCVKFVNNTHGDGRALVAEHLAGRCGKLIDAPVGAVALVNVPTHLTKGVTLTDGTTAVEAGIQHATRWRHSFSDKQGIAYTGQNRRRLGALQVLYTWVLCTGDHQLIYANADPFEVLSVDHSEFLPGSAGQWTPALLQQSSASVIADPFFDQAALGSTDRAPALRALRRLHEPDIARAVAAPPSSWSIAAADRIDLADYLWRRRQLVLDLWPANST